MHTQIPTELLQRYQQLFRKHHELLFSRNKTGRWSSNDVDAYRESKIRLDGMAELLGLTSEERSAIEKEAVK